MSLLNDMLNDLDENTPNKSKSSDGSSSVQLLSGDNDLGGSDLEDRASESKAIPVRTPKFHASIMSNPKKLILPALALGAVGFWLVFELNVFGVFPEASKVGPPSGFVLDDDWSARLKAKQKEDQAKVSSVSSGDTEEALGESGGNVAGFQKPLSIAEAASSADVVGNASEQAQGLDQPYVEVMLRKADELFNAGNLTEPKNANAFMLYQSVLALDSNNAGAKEGVLRVQADVLRNLQDRKYTKNKTDLKKYLEQAILVGLNPEVIQSYQLILNATMNSHAIKNKDAVNGKIVSRGNTSDDLGDSLAQTPVQGIKKSQPQSDHDLALKIDQQGYVGVEQWALEKISEKKTYKRTAIALTKAYFNSEKQDKLLALGELLGYQDTALSAFANAHFYVLTKQYTKAINQLSSSKLPKQQDAERVRMLAGLYQMNNDDANAEQLYGQLVRSRVANANDWLGLAVATDKLGKSQLALMAYQKVKSMGHQNPSVVDFVNSRIQQL